VTSSASSPRSSTLRSPSWPASRRSLSAAAAAEEEEDENEDDGDDNNDATAFDATASKFVCCAKRRHV